MNRSTREQLVGYLAGALDDAEREEVERLLASDADCRSELELLHASLEPLAAHREDFDPPPDLAERTAALVAEHATEFRPMPANRAIRDEGCPIGASGSLWSLADSVVVAGICLAAALLFFPVISNSRYVAQVTACQNNLRELGIALTDYSEKAGAGYFPGVADRGNRAFAGVYAPLLLEGGYLSAPRVIICPASRLARQIDTFRVPSLGQIDAATTESVVVLQELAGGSYGYNLGVVVNGRHGPPRNLGRSSFAIMSDMPSPYLGPLPSANHGGRGYNLLYEDGHVQFLEMRDQFLVMCDADSHRDHPFLSRRGVVEAGLDANDAVVGRSVAPPFQQAMAPFGGDFSAR